MESHQAYGPLLDSLRGLKWPSKERAAAGPPGVHRSSQRGVSGEFTEYRLYRQGDDPRTLDWKLLARSDRAFVRLTDDRALLTTWLVADASASMNFPEVGEGRTSKWQMACNIAVGLASVVNSSSDPVGLLTSGVSGLSRYPARARRDVIQELIRVLADTEPGGSGSLDVALKTISARSRIVLITDCLGEMQNVLRNASTLIAAGSQFECVHIVAAEELDPPRGAHVVHDPELSEINRAEVKSERASVLSDESRQQYLSRFNDFLETAREQWRSIGAGYTRVSTSQSAGRAVRAIVGGNVGGVVDGTVGGAGS